MPTMMSVFSGAMGLDLGLEQAGFLPCFAADSMRAAQATIEENRPDVPLFRGDVRLLTGAQMRSQHAGDVDLFVGGPPCQSFSTAGRRLGGEDAERGALVFEFVRLVEELRPRAFLLENVKGILSASVRWRALPYNNNGKRVDDLHGTVLQELLRRIRAIGYTVGHATLNAADFGAPQVRTRVFFFGRRDGRAPSFPTPTHAEVPDLLRLPWRPMREALEGMPPGSPGVQFSARKLVFLRHVPPGGNWRSLPESLQREAMGQALHAKGGRSSYWRRLSMDRPSPTILTEPNNAGTTLCHPEEDRPLSVRECARLQTFPDSWRFCGTVRDQYRLVGNAVPVVLARAWGQHILAVL